MDWRGYVNSHRVIESEPQSRSRYHGDVQREQCNTAEKMHECRICPVTDAFLKPTTMVIHFQYTTPTYTAVVCALGLGSPAFATKPPGCRKVVNMFVSQQCFCQVYVSIVIVLACRLLDRNWARITGNTHNNGRKDTESERVCHEKVDAKSKRTVQRL